MIRITDRSLCTGCTACENICPRDCISMEFDEYGHWYPKVNMDKCVDCGVCEKVCPMLHIDDLPKEENVDAPPIYAAFNKDSEVRSLSTSGGIFTVLAEYTLDKNGIVYAARFDDNYHIFHSSFESKDDINKFRGSKYAQSDLSDVFSRIKKQLRDGREVLFVGTPCQVAGLKGFLRKDYSNLLTCDFICMCISSPKIWEEYLAEYWDVTKLKRIVFKDKRNGWHNWQMLIEDNHGEHLCRGGENPFFSSYLSHITSRPSCHKCPFRHIHRGSDITIADCWGIDHVNEDFDDNHGCTTMILQSEKGKKCFGVIESKLNYMPFSIDALTKYNPYICRPITVSPQRDLFYRHYWKYGLRYAFDHAKTNNSILSKTKNKIKHILGL